MLSIFAIFGTLIHDRVYWYCDLLDYSMLHKHRNIKVFTCLRVYHCWIFAYKNSFLLLSWIKNTRGIHSILIVWIFLVYVLHSVLEGPRKGKFFSFVKERRGGDDKRYFLSQQTSPGIFVSSNKRQFFSTFPFIFPWEVWHSRPAYWRSGSD